VATHTAAPARWFDQRRNDSPWQEISMDPAERSLFADENRPSRQRTAKLKQDQDHDAVKAQEESNMHKANGIGKFLEIGSVVQGAARSPRWFSLPGSWRAPRIQIMRKSEPTIATDFADRRTARMLTSATGSGG
jgi:hypothetical protein